jgi:Uma2 family endonuclease
MSAPLPPREAIPVTDTLELPPPGQATYADLEALPERYLGQIIDGTLHAQAQPAYPHQRAATRLSVLLGQVFDRSPGGPGGPGGWWFLHEPELHFGADVLVPDIAGWRRERMPQVPDVPWTDLAPDWLCEILSPSTEHLDRGPKLDIYHRAGVRHAWLVEPAGRQIEVLQRGEEGWRVVAAASGDGAARLEPFAALPLLLGDLWLGPQSLSGNCRERPESKAAFASHRDISDR